MVEKAGEYFGNVGACLREMQREGDRGAALLGSALLEDRIGKLLTKFLADSNSSRKLLSGSSAPLGTFSARIEMAHALGLLTDEEYGESSAVQKIRNGFAHSCDPLSFQDQRLSDLARTLRWLGEGLPDADSEKPRERFNLAVVVNNHSLEHRLGDIVEFDLRRKVLKPEVALSMTLIRNDRSKQRVQVLKNTSEEN